MYLTLVTVLTLPRGWGDDVERALGGTAGRIVTTIVTQYRGDVIDIYLRVAVFAAVVGAAGGAFAGLAVRLASGRRAQRPVEAALVLALLVCLHAAALGGSIAHAPALYADTLYARAGWGRDLELLITERLGPWKAVAIPSSMGMALVAFAWLEGRRRLRAGSARYPLGLALPASAMAAVAGLCFLVTGGRISRPPPPRVDTTRPNVLVLAADSLRTDAVTPELMPTLSRLAERGTRFARHYSSIARTMPSWVTILTGLYPHHHGIRSSYPRADEFSQSFASVPRELGRAGYATTVVSDYGGDIFGTVNLGFTTRDTPQLNVRTYIDVNLLSHAYLLVPFTSSRGGRRLFPAMREWREAANADVLADDAIDQMRALAGTPFLEVVFFSRTHEPFAAELPYYRQFADPSYSGLCKYYRPLAFPRDDAGPVDVRQLRALYRGSAASVDSAAGRVLHELDVLGLAESTIVVIASDHGEDLYEAGTSGHGNNLFGDEQNHVPFAILDPRGTGSSRVVDTLSRDIDVAPTLYDLVGVPAPAGLDGHSLVGQMRGERASEPLIFAETALWLTPGFYPNPSWRIPYPGLIDLVEVDKVHTDTLVLRPELDVRTTFAKHRMVFDGRMKLVYAPTPTGPLYLLYDTITDPLNRHDLANEAPEARDRLKASLWGWMLEDRAMEEEAGFLAPRAMRMPEVSRGSVGSPDARPFPEDKSETPAL